MSQPCCITLFLVAGLSISPAFARADESESDNSTQAASEATEAASGSGEGPSPRPITFPSDAGIIDVRAFGAVPDDGEDDTEAIQAALDHPVEGPRLVYLPPGSWMVRDTLRWSVAEGDGDSSPTVLQGAGRELSRLYVPDDTRPFSDPQKPRAVVWTGAGPGECRGNAIRDLAIDVGEENRGAIGVQFYTTEQGSIRNVTLRAAKRSGNIGLDLGHTNGIGPLFVQNLIVEGFEIGINTKWPVHSATFEHVHLIDQRRYGWWNYHQMVFVRGLVSENRTTAVYNEKWSWGSMLLMNSHLHGVDAIDNRPGIQNERWLDLHDVELYGYPNPLDHEDKGRTRDDIREDRRIEHHSSHPHVRSLFRKVRDGTFATAGEIPSLPVREIPDVPRGDPEDEWANLRDFGADPTGQKDASDALQRAIDAGYETVYLPGNARFHFDDVVRLRGPLRRIIGLAARFTVGDDAVWKLVDDDHPEGWRDSPVVVLERLAHPLGDDSIRIRHDSDRTLVISSARGFDVEGEDDGDLFLDDFRGHLELAPGQDAWCRQICTHQFGTKILNRGGRLWILGCKAENPGALVETTDGGHTEINGVYLHSNRTWPEDMPAFVIRDATVVLRGVNERNFNRNPVSLWVRETQDGETKELHEMPRVFLGK